MSESEVKPATLSSTSKKKNPLVVLLIIVAVIALIGFLVMIVGSFFIAGKVAQKLKQSGVQYNTGNNSFTVKDSKTGEAVNIGTSASLPANFPKNFPIYSGAKPITSVTNNDGFAVNFMIQGSPSKTVVDWYRIELPKNGWTVKESSGGLNAVEFSDSTYSGTLFVLSDKTNSSMTVNLKTK